jgi:lipid A 4'-phosphatase
MNTTTPSSSRRQLLTIAAVVLIAAAFWAASPQLDLALSALFYRSGEGFYLGEHWPLPWIYRRTYTFIGIAAVSLVGSYLYALLPTTKWDHAWRGRLIFLMLSLALGPGLVTNTLLKNHLGRPRPEQIVNFGGSGHYVAPLVPSTQCGHNCSFPSGHAASGFWVITGAWIWARHRRRWLLAGCITGTIVGLTRIVQGGHFLSDVLGALAVVWLVNAALSRIMLYRGWLRPVDTQNSFD